ncbi:conjugal transfer protein [Neobacillus notoginsengisoli]|uniref:Conjugal transfer protein n=1 Tax=Neobacillus notoginsengisoli TaxID=1578198 RepID=A0A417YJR7_9BACI|nr:glucosaminidase domain-containing protein [Neobacillus notoginsengisoli]RHW33319.1 conjugal transfer protein [Neobacillus notoginsengisoli]
MNVGPLSSNWLLYKTLMDTAFLSQNRSLGPLGFSGSSFQLLLEQALLQAENNNRFVNHPALEHPTLANLGTVKLSNISLPPLSEAAGISTGLTSGGIDASSLNRYLKGALQGTGEHFVEAGKQYSINPALLAAISIHETGNGSSNAARYKFNVAGMMGKSGLKTYSSVRDSIFDMARNLRKNYLDEGKLTISQIGAKYAPIGAGNDPTNLNNHWVTGVNRQFASLTEGTGLA